MKGYDVASASVRPEPWRDIASAPKDGTPVFLCREGDPNWTMRVRRNYDGRWRGGDGYDATHWRPLPSPPSAMLAATGGRDE